MGSNIKVLKKYFIQNPNSSLNQELHQHITYLGCLHHGSRCLARAPPHSPVSLSILLAKSPGPTQSVPNPLKVATRKDPVRLVLCGSLATQPNINIWRPKTNLEILVIDVSSSNVSFDTKSNHRYPRIHLKDFFLKESSLDLNAAVSVQVWHQ